MASPVAPISRQEVSALIRQVQGNQLINRQLSSVCQVNGLKSTGVKAELQRRIIDLIQETVNANDVSRFHQVRQSIVNAFVQRSSPSSKASAAAAARSISSASAPSPLPGPQLSSPMSFNHSNGPNAYQQRGPYHGVGAGPSAGHAPAAPYGAAVSPLTFRPSPFYRVESQIGARVCEVMAQHRNSITTPVKLNDHPMLQRCLSDKSYRVMVFCADDSAGIQDVLFPHQSELKVNCGEIKANLRGLKNKPGSTRPVDITQTLRLKPNYTNNIEFTYALTNKVSRRPPFEPLLFQLGSQVRLNVPVANL